MQKKGETNIFPVRTDRTSCSSIRFILCIDYPACCFLFRVKLVYVQAGREKVQQSKNCDMTV